MKVLRWSGPGYFDGFAICNQQEYEELQKKYPIRNIAGANFSDGKYYFLISTFIKKFSPLPMLSLAFGGQWNDHPPYGEKLEKEVNLLEYRLDFFDFEKWEKEQRERPKMSKEEIKKRLSMRAAEYHMFKDD